MKKILLLSFLAVIVSGCTDPLGIIDLDPNTRSFTDAERAQNYFNNSTIQCASSDCEPSAGGLYSYTPQVGDNVVGSCSLTLIAPDKVLTNFHCLPEDIAYAGASCANRINVILPAAKGYAADSIPCESVLKVTSRYKVPGDPDWAVLKLSRSSTHPPVRVSTNGITHNGKATLFPTFFNLKGEFGRGNIKRVECTSNSTFLFASAYVNSRSAIFNIDSCGDGLVSGTSGTGVRNVDNELVGIYSFGDQEKTIEEKRKKYPKLTDDYGGGTNLACVPYFFRSGNGFCNYSNKKDYRFISYISHFTYQQRAGENYTDIAEDITREYNKPEYEEKMKPMVSGTQQLAQRLSIPIGHKSMVDERHFVASRWLSNLLPVMPECFHRDRMKDEFSIVILTRSTRNGLEIINPDNYYQSYSSKVAKHTFTVEFLEDHFVIKPKYGLLWSKSYRELTGSDWTDLEYKVDICAPPTS